METNSIILSSSSQIIKDLQALKAVFDKEDIQFAITGSLALIMHGIDFQIMALMPNDIDIIVEDTDRSKKLLETLSLASANAVKSTDKNYPENSMFTFKIGYTTVNAWIDNQNRFENVGGNADLSYFKLGKCLYPIVGISPILIKKFGYGRIKDYKFNNSLQDLFNFYLK